MKTSPQKRRNTIALLILAFGILILLFYQTPLMRRARGATWQFLVRHVANILDVGTISVQPDVMDQLQKLRIENTRLSYEVRDYARLKHELGVPSFAGLRSVPTAVLARPIDTFGTEYMLAKGISDGITLQAPVVLYDSLLIGFISDVQDHTSTVRLLIHPTTSLTAEVMIPESEGSPARGLLIGQQYTSLLLTTIPRDLHISKGEPVVTVAHEGVPAGLMIGAVDEIFNKENEPYQQATLELPYDPDSIDAVHVLVP